MSKKKLASITLASMLVLILAVSGATFALFTNSSTNAGNTFSTGTLSFDSHRHDVPITGPMFYTHDSDDGWMGTGLWAPKDVHTRAMLIKNTGTLDGKIESVSAFAQSSSGAEADFAEQALVTIAVLDIPPEGHDDWAPDAIDDLNHLQNAAYEAGMSFWLTRPATRTAADLAADVREAFQELIFRSPFSGLIVKEVYSGTLADLMNGSDPFRDVVVPAGSTIYMGYTVDFQDHPNNNAVKDKNLIFGFQTNFVQARNN